MKESLYNIKISLRNERMLIYNSLSRSMCLLEKKDRDQLEVFLNSKASSDSNELNQLMEQGFLLTDEVDELSIVEKLYQQTRFQSDSINLIVCPTLACNFGCDYCFQGKNKSKELMNQEVQDGIIALYQRVLSLAPHTNHIQLIWYGGEPLLKVNVIYELADRLIPLIKEANLNYSAAMVSNGYMLNKEVAKKLAARGLKTVQITLDGTQEYHDSRRHLLSKRGTYSKILSNILEWIDEVPIHVSIRVNIDERNRNDIRSLLDDLVEKGFSKKENFKLYFAPVESMTMGCHNVSDKMMKKVQYGQLEAELYRYAFEKGIADLPYPPYFIGICSAVRPYDYIVVPNGDIHKCWDTVSYPDKKVGSVFDLDALFNGRSPLKQRWDMFNPFTHNTCRNCKILPNCAGACAHKFVHASESIGEASLPCPSLKYSIKEKIIYKAEKEGYITKEDYDPEMIKTDPRELCSEIFNRDKYILEETEGNRKSSLKVLKSADCYGCG